MSKPEEVVTEDEIRRVHKLECRQSGHTFTHVMAAGSYIPSSIICTHCSSSWTIGICVSDNSDLALVCETALSWAGEYGFQDPDRATTVVEAIARLRPDMYQQWEEGR